MIEGHVAAPPDRRHRVAVIDGDGQSWKVPAAVLESSDQPRRTALVTGDDVARAGLRVGDEVTFRSRRGIERGRITKLNPRRARVRCGQTAYDVSYGLLRTAADAPSRNGAERLHGIVALAQELMARHGLDGWTFALVESGRRLGDCRYRDRLIRVSRAHALDGDDAEIRDTILHEIAHALAGPEAGHGPVWRQTARRIGATPRARAHEGPDP